MSVENGLDELWVGVKCQSNAEIAGSPRNALRCSVVCCVVPVEPLDGLGASPGYQSQPNSEWYDMKGGSETAGDKLRSREGNSPDPLLRSPRID
jgi:hypothetical protein